MNHYFSFKEKSTRQEFWAVMLITNVGLFALAFLLEGNTAYSSEGAIFVALTSIAAVIAGAWAMLATGARRCRDAALSAWWTVLLAVPYLSFVVMLVLGILPPDNKENDNDVSST